MPERNKEDDELGIVITPKSDKIIEHKVKRTKVSRIIECIDTLVGLVKLLKRKK